MPDKLWHYSIASRSDVVRHWLEDEPYKITLDVSKGVVDGALLLELSDGPYILEEVKRLISSTGSSQELVRAIASMKEELGRVMAAHRLAEALREQRKRLRSEC